MSQFSRIALRRCSQNVFVIVIVIVFVFVFVFVNFFGHVMSSHHSEQMSQRSQVSRIALSGSDQVSCSSLFLQHNVSCGRSQNHQGYQEWSQFKTEANLPYRNEKEHKNTDSGLVQQLSLSVPTAREDLAPQVQAGCGRGEHDQELLLQTKAAHALGGVVAARPGEDLPGDVVGVECVTVET